MAAILIAYDVETILRNNLNPPDDLAARTLGGRRLPADTATRFFEKATALHSECRIPGTLFVAGMTAEENPEGLKTAAACRYLEIGSHAYSHRPFKTVLEFKGMDLPGVREDVRLARKVLLDAGVDPKGMTAPFTYSYGLLDRPDVREVLRAEGFQYVRSWGRDENSRCDLSFSVQPFFYDDGLLEIPCCSWFDVEWRLKVGGWSPDDGFKNDVMKKLVSDIITHEVKGNDRTWSTGFHDWPLMATDPDLDIIRHIVTLGRELEIPFFAHHEFCRRLRRKLTGGDGT